MKTFRVINSSKGSIAYDGNRVVGIHTYGPRGGQWLAEGYFDSQNYSIVKGNGDVEGNVIFGEVNAKNYLPVIQHFYERDGALYVGILKRTARWSHGYLWRVEPKGHTSR